MKKIVLSVMLFSCATILCSAQNIQFQKTFGEQGTYESIVKIIKKADNGFMVLANAQIDTAAPKTDIVVVSMDSLGNVLWSKNYGTADQDFPVGIAAASDGGYFVGGRTFLADGFHDDFLIFKISDVGDIVWQTSYGGADYDEATGIAATSDGVVIFGQTSSAGAADYGLVLKFSNAGTMMWEQSYQRGNDFSCKFYDADVNTNDEIALVGTTASVFVPDIFVSKLSNMGDTIWSSTLGSSGKTEIASSVRYTATGDIMVSGYHSLPNTALQTNLFAAKFTATGDTTFFKSYGTTAQERATCMAKTKDNKFVIGGFFKSGSSTSQKSIGLALKINDLGVIEGAKSYGDTTHYGIIYSMSELNENGYAFGGETYTYGDSIGDIFMGKTNAIDLTSCNENNYSIATYHNTLTLKKGAVAAFPADLTSLSNLGIVLTQNDYNMPDNIICLVTGINSKLKKELASVYPNPANSAINITLTQAGNNEITITDLNGRVMYQKNTSFLNSAISLANFANGVYFVSVKNNNQVDNLKFVKE